MIDDPTDRLLVCENICLAHLVPGHGVADQLLGEREVALIPDHQVVQLHYLAGGAGRLAHANTSSASIRSSVPCGCAARHVSTRWRLVRVDIGNDSAITAPSSDRRACWFKPSTKRERPSRNAKWIRQQTRRRCLKTRRRVRVPKHPVPLSESCKVARVPRHCSCRGTTAAAVLFVTSTNSWKILYESLERPHRNHGTRRNCTL